MSSMHPNEYLTQAIDLTNDILKLLDSEEFDAIDEVFKKREPMIKQAFSGSLAEVDEIRALHLKKLNDEALHRLVEFKKTVAETQVKIKRGVKATRAYETTANS